METFWIIFGFVLQVLEKISMFLGYSFHALLLDFFFHDILMEICGRVEKCNFPRFLFLVLIDV